VPAKTSLVSLLFSRVCSFLLLSFKRITFIDLMFSQSILFVYLAGIQYSFAAVRLWSWRNSDVSSWIAGEVHLPRSSQTTQGWTQSHGVCPARVVLDYGRLLLR